MCKQLCFCVYDLQISTAVKFLQNPRVATRPRSEKELFLQRKGLNHAEISAAFEASGMKETKSVCHFYPGTYILKGWILRFFFY